MIFLQFAYDDELHEILLDLQHRLLRARIKNKVDLYVNVVVLDEVVWILHKKYSLLYEDINNYLNRILYGVKVLALDESDYRNMMNYLIKYRLQPSDALHASSISRLKIQYVITEDAGFNQLEFTSRIWIENKNELFSNLEEPTSS